MANEGLISLGRYWAKQPVWSSYAVIRATLGRLAIALEASEARAERLAAVLNLQLTRHATSDPNTGTPVYEAGFCANWLARIPGWEELAAEEAAAWLALQPEDLGEPGQPHYDEAGDNHTAPGHNRRIDMEPSEKMSRVVDGHWYSVAGATLVAHDRY